MSWFILNASCPVCRHEYSSQPVEDTTGYGNILGLFLEHTRNRINLIERATAATHFRVRSVETRLSSIQTLAFVTGFIGAFAGIVFANYFGA
jgi:hypothetical protein